METDMDMFDWTIMIYFGGDNNLAEEMIWGIKDIQAWRAADPKANVKVCLLFDGGGPPVPIDDDKLVVYKRAALHAILDAGVEERNEVDQRRAERRIPPKVLPIKDTLKEFVNDVLGKFEAKRYMLVLAGHGSGAVGDFLTGDKRVFGLTIRGLGEVLKAVQKEHGTEQKPIIDILGMDSCQMSMAEVACEVQGAVQLMVGTEGFQPNAGWPYANVLGLLNDKKIAAEPGGFAEAIVRAHIGYYLDYALADLSTDMSVVNLTKFDDLQKALKRLTSALGFKRQTERQFESIAKLPAKELRAKLKAMPTTLSDSRLTDSILLAHWYAQGYKRQQYVDLWDFCDQLFNRLADFNSAEIKEVSDACNDIKNVIEPTTPTDPNERFIRISGYSGPQFQHSHGISVFFPWASLTDAAGVTDLEYYHSLKFARETAWDEFIQLYVHKTQREVREKNTTGKPLPSLINRRTGLFAPFPGRDPDAEPADHAAQTLGVPRIESMKNPPIEWKKWEGAS
jgi:Clostripain family